MSMQQKLTGGSPPVNESAEPDSALSQPEEPRIPSHAALILWLVVIGMTVVLLPLYFAPKVIRDNAQGLETELASIRASLTNVPTALPEIQRLLTPLAQVQAQITQVSTVYPTLAARRLDWASVMATIGNYSSDEIVLTSLMGSDNRITLSGRALRDDVIVAYARSLEQSKLFSRVTIQSIQTVPVAIPTLTLTPTATPSVTPSMVPPTLTNTPSPIATSTSLWTPSPTLDLRDRYEPDETQPQPIGVGQVQSHNFYPNFDADTVSFLAKAGRFYRVYTADLTPGTDTFLTVLVRGVTHSNDDVKPGIVSSEVVFQNLDSDVMVLAIVTNRGQYGPDTWYKLVVEEVTTTPTATPSITATPTASPTVTPSPRDPYEPDDVPPSPITMGETQTHNFNPLGDIDRVSFAVKANRYYQVLTLDLALGVDTVITVRLDSQQWVNDDWSSEPGNFASAICFQGPQDSPAVVTIANVAQQYGPDKTYGIRVTEVTSLNTPPCPPASSALPVPRLAWLGARVTWTDSTDLPSEWLRPAIPLSIKKPEPAQLAAMPIRFVIMLELKGG